MLGGSDYYKDKTKVISNLITILNDKEIKPYILTEITNTRLKTIKIDTNFNSESQIKKNQINQPTLFT